MTPALAVAAFAALCGWASNAEAQDEPAPTADSAASAGSETSVGAEETTEAATSKEAAEERRDKKNEELADRIKSVQRKVFLKKERFEIFPFFALDLNDPLFNHYILGGSLAYHLVDSLALEVRGGAVIASTKQGIIKIVQQEVGAVLENPPDFKGHVDGDLTWAPFYGKISIFGEGLLHFDTYLTGGPGVFITDLGAAPAFNIGIGQRYFINRWLVARIELRNYVFVQERNNSSRVDNLMVLGFSVSGFFPTSFEYEFQ